MWCACWMIQENFKSERALWKLSVTTWDNVAWSTMLTCWHSWSVELKGLYLRSGAAWPKMLCMTLFFAICSYCCGTGGDSAKGLAYDEMIYLFIWLLRRKIRHWDCLVWSSGHQDSQGLEHFALWGGPEGLGVAQPGGETVSRAPDSSHPPWWAGRSLRRRSRPLWSGVWWEERCNQHRLEKKKRLLD